jgi:hypothetical protein
MYPTSYPRSRHYHAIGRLVSWATAAATSESSWFLGWLLLRDCYNVDWDVVELDSLLAYMCVNDS